MINETEVAVRVCLLTKEDRDANNSYQWTINEKLMFLVESASENLRIVIDGSAESGFFEGVTGHFMEAMASGLESSVLVIGESFRDEESVIRGTSDITGIVTCAARSIFKQLDRNKCCVSASYFEICSNHIKDLLEENGAGVTLCRDMSVLEKLKRLQVDTPDTVAELVMRGARRQSIESGAHTLFCINLDQQTGEGDGVEAHLSFVFLTGCVDLAGASGDQADKGCTHFMVDQIVDLLNKKEKISVQDEVFTTILRHCVGRSSVLCTITPGMSNILHSVGCHSEVEDAAASRDSDASCQDESDVSACDQESTNMCEPFPSPIQSPLLETIEEEEEEDDVFYSLYDVAASSTRKKGESSSTADRRQHVACQMSRKPEPENGMSELMERISYYQRKYDELRDFTYNEKKIYEETFNMQLSEAESRIEELKDRNRHLEGLLQDTRGDQEELLVTDHSKDELNTERELEKLKQQLQESELMRNDYETKLELIETNLRNRNRELTQCLEAAWTEISILSAATGSDVGSGESNDCDVISLKREICFLQKQNAKYYHLSHKIQEYCKLKKCLVQESKLAAQMADLEQETQSLKQTNAKLSEYVEKKSLEAEEMAAMYSLLKEECYLIRNENAQLRQNFKEKFEELKKMNSENSKLKEEIDLLLSKNIDLSTNWKGKVESMSSLLSENSKMKEEIGTLRTEVSKLSVNLTEKISETKELVSKIGKLNREIHNIQSDNTNLSNTLEEKMLQISSENSLQCNEICLLKCKESKLVDSKEKSKNSTKHLKIPEAHNSELNELKMENLQLRDKISFLELRLADVLSASEAVKVKELDPKTSELEEDLCCVTQKNCSEPEESDTGNIKLKDEVSLLKEENSETLKQRNIQIEDLTIENSTLKEEICSMKNMWEAYLGETCNKMKALDTHNTALKNELCSLTCELEKETESLNELVKKQDGQQIQTAALENKVSTLKDEIVSFHKRKVQLLVDLNHTLQNMSNNEAAAASYQNSVGTNSALNGLSKEFDTEKEELNLRQRLKKLLQNFKISEERFARVNELEAENSDLKNRVSSLECRLADMSKILTTETDSVHLELQEELCSLAEENLNLSRQLEERECEVRACEYENEKMQEEMSLLKQDSLTVSQQSRHMMQDVVNENVTLKKRFVRLKTAWETFSKEIFEKVTELDSQNSYLENNLRSLTTEFQKAVDLKNFFWKQEEDEVGAISVENKLSEFKKQILLLHKKNVELSNELKKTVQKFNNIKVWSPSVVNMNLKENASALNCESPAVDTEYELRNLQTKAKHLSACHTSASSPGERLQSAHTSLLVGMVLDEQRRANDLRTKLLQQKQLHNMVQRREQQMKTDMELHKRELENLQNLKQDAVLHNYRISQLELQAQHEEYFHRSQVSCLETFIASLRNENLVLKTKLQHARCLLRKTSQQSKRNQHCSQPKYKQASVQTAVTLSDCLAGSLNFPQSVPEEVHLPKVHVKCRSTGVLPHPEGQSHNLKCSSEAQIQNTKSTQKRYIPYSIENKVPKFSVVSPTHKCPCGLACGQEGAEGWARLGRESDVEEHNARAFV